MKCTECLGLGYALFNSDSCGWEIERCDSCHQLSGDEEAAARCFADAVRPVSRKLSRQARSIAKALRAAYKADARRAKGRKRHAK